MKNTLLTILDQKKFGIVGTVSLIETLQHLTVSSDVTCDIIEARLDMMQKREIEALSYCEKIETHGKPVIVTIRLAAEGGKWAADDDSRKNLFYNALETVSAIDVELRSELLPQLYTVGTSKNKLIIISFHDFNKTPKLLELNTLLKKVKMFPSAVLKIAVRTETTEELECIKTFLRSVRDRKICMLCMGNLAKESRVKLPAIGSCLTYGYIDQPVAPEQPDCLTLRVALDSQSPNNRRKLT